MSVGTNPGRGAPPFGWIVAVEHWKHSYVPGKGQTGRPFGIEVVGTGAADEEDARHRAERLVRCVPLWPGSWARVTFKRVCQACKAQSAKATRRRRRVCRECNGCGSILVARWSGIG